MPFPNAVVHYVTKPDEVQLIFICLGQVFQPSFSWAISRLLAAEVLGNLALCVGDLYMYYKYI
jgi:hypothetical protein